MKQIHTSIARPGDRPATAAALHVEVVADLVCPFCFLGKRRLDAAMQAVQGPSEISWYPYQLNPDMPAEGLSLDEYLTLRFGNPVNVQPVLDELAAEGRLEDIAFRFDRITRVPNTMRAHLLMYLAEREGADQSALADELMRAYFERGEDIGDAGILAELAARHGIESGAVHRVFSDDTARQAVQSREAQVRASGLAGVPGFLLNRRLLVVGAQETDALVNAFDRAMFGEGTDQFESPALH